ncbi:MAG: DNA topoisomerase I [Candidatus Cloacimonas sp. 4484_209]|nr:MAG: DNA topoisomerase I [Candidatus Cloacimonas sp. 4484_209]
MNNNQKKEKLLVVESPTKAKTIARYLKGEGFNVLSSNGHIKDLKKNELSVDIENNFKPTYVIIKGKSKIVKTIKAASKKADAVFIATDPDREGEAIAYHISQEIDSQKVPFRVLFYEITQDSIKQGLKEPGYININLVKSQQARRILDRLVGYKISPYLWKTIRRGLSAGRVQTVALRLICEREDQIEKFVKKEYWTIQAEFEKLTKEHFKANLVKIDGKKPDIKTEKETDKLIVEIGKEKYEVLSYEEKKVEKSPPPPYITSNLQLEASRKFNFSAKQTMMIAQQLFEGIELGEEGPVGLITYMRTDSFRVSEKSVEEARKFISSDFGEQYLPKKPRVFKSKKGAQGAHEAIRPTSVFRTPQKISSFLNKNQLKIYTIIWNKFLASQMSNAIFDLKTAEIGGGRFIFRAQAKKLIFDGYQKILKSQTKNNENDITILKEKEEVKLISANKEQHFTEPPGRFTEGSLVKELESKGIGRPSTYASIISTVQTRGYVLKKKRYLYPTELGKIVLQLLLNYFDNIFDYDFTKEMEEQLDEIENGKKDILPILKKFYSSLEKKLSKAGREIAKAKKDIEEKTDIKCEICGRPMVIKWGKYGKFLACSGYPECKNTKPLEEEKVEGKCPKCGAPLVIKRGKFGRFVSCSNYPKCDYTSSIKTGVKCPVEGCDGDIVEKTTKKGKRFYGCSRYPKCKFALWDKPVNKPCPECGYPLLVEKYGRNGVYLKCPKCGAKFSQDDKK